MKQSIEHGVKAIQIDFVSAGRHNCAPQQNWGPSSRDYYLIHFIVNGAGRYNLGNTYSKVEAGQCFFIPENALSFYSADQHNPWSYYWIAFRGSDAEAMCDACGFSLSNPVVSIRHINKITNHIDHMIETDVSSLSSEVTVESLLLQIFSCILEERKTNLASARMEIDQDQYMQKALTYIQNHVGEQLTVSQVAKELFIGRTLLFQLSRKYFNLSPRQLITHAKIIRACELLKTTDDSIKNISDMCGYTNQFAFSRAFRRECGIAPSEFRQIYRNSEESITTQD